MPTKPINNIKKSSGLKQIFYGIEDLIDNTISFNQGDILVYDATTKKIKAISSEAESQQLLGVAVCTVENGKIKSPYLGTAVDAAQGSDQIPSPVYGVEVELKLKSGESLQAGDVVYADPATDAQTVKATAGSGVAIGVYNGKPITGASDTKIRVTIGCRYPDNELKF